MNVNRRKFLKTSGAGMAGSLLIPSIVQSCQSTVIPPNVQAYLDHFEVSPGVLRKVISTALSKGGDYADLYFEHKILNSLGLEDGKVNRAYSNIDFGVGIRVLKGDQTGFAYSENISTDAMLKAAKTAANIASGTKNIPADELAEAIPPDFYSVEKSWEEVGVQQKVSFVQKLNDKIFSLDERVSKVNVYQTDEVSYVLFYNSEGLVTYDYRPLVSMGAVCIMEKNGKMENSYTSRSFRKGFEFLNDELIDLLAQESIDKTSILFDATKPKAGEMPVVMGAGGSGILLHEAIGHTFEADFNRKGTSIFADKMGKKVAENFVNIIDDGTLPGNRGSINMDDEGTQSEKTYLVKDGVLNSYIHDRISAKHYDVSPTGNGRRESFRHVPLPRMRSTYMEVGPHSKDDIITNVKSGIYVDNFSNGEVKIGAGDFTFFVKSGYLIENGKLTQPIKDINIIGNGPQALADITMCANDYLIDNGTWTCGKSGQSVPVTCGLPTVLVKKLTVGGVNA
ncbi:TldD/PmbA family protein [Sunxiuqinia sp. A32]|uniref:TldD/PmbA family protein n=1 Tax=Sunxiuqinia sp. A32 TaxID=3461496 RepID=UPI004045F1B4